MSGNTTIATRSEGRDISGLLRDCLRVLIGLKLLLLPLIFDVNTFAAFDAPKAALSHALAWVMVAVVTLILIKESRLSQFQEALKNIFSRETGDKLAQHFFHPPEAYAKNAYAAHRQNSRKDISQSFLHLLVLGFVVSAILSTIFAADRYIALFGYPYRLLGLTTILDLSILYAAIMIAVQKLRDFRLIIWSLVAGAVISTLYALLQSMGFDVFVWGSQLGARVFSTFGNPDFYGQYLSVLVISLAGIIIFHPLRRRFRIPLLLVLALALYLVGVVGTRSALIGIGAGVIMIMALWIRRTQVTRTTMIKRAFFFLTGIIIIAALLSQTYISERLSWYWIQRGFKQRGIIYETALREFADHPIFGIGPDNIGVLYFRYRPARELSLRGPFYLDSSAHGWPVQILATQGIVGFAIFLTILFVTLRIAWTLAPHAGYGSFASIVAAALAAFFGTGLMTPNSISTEWIGWTGIALLAGINGLAEGKQRLEKREPVNNIFSREKGDKLAQHFFHPPEAYAKNAYAAHRQNSRKDVFYRFPKPVLSSKAIPWVSAPLIMVVLVGIFFSIRPWIASRYAAIPVFLLNNQSNARNQYTSLNAVMKATELDPGRADLWKLRGSVEENVGNLNAALSSYAEAARLAPDYPEHWWNLSRINVRLVEKGDITKKKAALSAMEQAIVSDPNGPESYASSAKLLLLLGENQRALESAQQGIKLFSTKTDYYILAATAAHRLKREDEAESILKNGISIFLEPVPELTVPLRLALAQLYLELREIKKSQEQIALVLERDPNNADALAIRNKLTAKGNLKM